MVKNKNKLIAIITIILLIAMAVLLFLAYYFNIFPKKIYYSEDFGISPVKSQIDFNGNGIDDYTDILLGARVDAEKHPTYDSRYWAEGYPPENIGVCTDVVWRAFKNAGYSLRDMVDADIQNRPEAYPNITTRDNNIDFRRVVNLHTYFEKYAISLSTDIDDISVWQAGDIVIFDDDKHIGIVSDKRNSYGQPYIIHNGGQDDREEDLFKRNPFVDVTAHYRFDASLVSNEFLIKFSDEN